MRPACAATAAAGADDPFYKGKRLNLIINFAAGGPSDIEGRLLAKHLVKHIDGAPGIIVQNKDGAGGLVGANYIGELGPKDGSMLGYITATAWTYVVDPALFRVDFKSYEFIASQPGNAVSYVRADAEPGIRDAVDIMKAKDLVAGGLSVNSSKDVLIRLQLDMLGVPYRYVTGYRSNTAARLALQRNEVNFFTETTPAYFSVVEPSMVKPGQVVPIYYDPNYNGESFSAPKVMQGSAVLPFHEFYRKIKGTLPTGRLWDVYRTNLAVDSAMLRLIVMPPGSPKAAVDALRTAVARLNDDKDYAEEAMKIIQFVPQYETGAGHRRAGAQAARGRPRDPGVRRRLHQGREEVRSSCASQSARRSIVSRATGAGSSRADGDRDPAQAAKLHRRSPCPWAPAKHREERGLHARRHRALRPARAAAAHADDPFYKGRRLTILVNFAAGGPTDIEARMFAKHLVRHIDGAPNIVIQNMDGAGGVVGAKYMGEVAPRDGTMAGYFTGTAFIYALDPERFRVDFKSYEFVATQAGTTVHFVRTDVPPGMKQATDIVKATGLIGGGLSVDTSKDIRMRLAFDMLGIPYKYVTGYRSSPAARLALQRGEINFFAESPPSYRGIIEPSMVATGQVIPVFYDPSWDGQNFIVPHPVKGLTILPFHELYRKIKGTMPSGQLWDIYKSIISADGIIQRMIVMPPGAPKPAVEAIRAAIPRLNADKVYAEEAEKAFGFVPQWEAGPDTNALAQNALTVRPQVRAFLTDYMKNVPK